VYSLSDAAGFEQTQTEVRLSWILSWRAPMALLLRSLTAIFPPGGGRVQGVLGEGTITSANLVGPLAGMNLSVLVAAMRAGGTIVMVTHNPNLAIVCGADPVIDAQFHLRLRID
jgi:hypothetical protein